jgi:hypothetical protein
MTVRPVGKRAPQDGKIITRRFRKGRANAVGAANKKYFDLQKSQGAIAKNVEVVVKPIGEGDKEERDLIGPPIGSP